MEWEVTWIGQGTGAPRKGRHTDSHRLTAAPPPAHSSETRRVMPADVVVLEGILVLHMEEIRSLLNMKVYVDTDDDVRLARRWVEGDGGWG